MYTEILIVCYLIIVFLLHYITVPTETKTYLKYTKYSVDDSV